MKKLFLTLSLLFSFVCTLAVKADDTIKIASDSVYAPFEFQDDSGKYVGIDVDLMHTIAEMNGWDIDMEFPGFQAAVDKLSAGQADAVIAGMSITDERKKVFDFSDPYYDSAIVIGTNKKGNISSYDQLKGITIGVKNGTTSQEWLTEHEKEYGFKIKVFDEGAQMYDSLSVGDVKAVMDDAPVMQYAAAQGSDLAINMEPEKVGSYGFAVKKGTHKELIDGFNKSLKELKANGGYQAIVEKYTGKSDTSEAPANMPAKTGPLLKIASDSVYAPFEFQDDTGTYVGIDVDLMHTIADMNGWNIEMEFPGFQAAVDKLSAGQADAVIAGMSITDERKKVFDFSDPYYDSAIVIGTNKKGNISSYDQLEGITIGVKNGTTSQEWLTTHEKEYGYKVKVFDEGAQMYDSLSVGDVAAVMDDAPVMQYAEAQGSDIAINIEPEKVGSYGFAVKKGTHPELIEGFNKALKELRDNGGYQAIVDKYTAAPKKEASSDKPDETTMLGLLQNNWKQLMAGLGKTMSLTIVSFAFALIVGTLVGLIAVSPTKALRVAASWYTDIVRGIPLMVLAIFIFYGIPNLLQLITGKVSPMPEFAAGVIALTLNASAYIAEIVRGGVQAVPPGQMEASRSLGVSYGKTMQRVILPQALKITVPSLVNQFIISLKDTTIISAIGYIELLQTAKIINARTYQSFKVYGLVLIIYLVIILVLTRFARRLEKNMK
jgi:polar amino acid transport system substrate-binding protein